MSTITYRTGSPADATRCGDICYEAFTAFNQVHGFPPDFPNRDVAHGLMAMMFSSPHVYSVVAQLGDRIIGSNFLWDGTIGGIGPITVDPMIQEQGVGRRLMEMLLAEGDRRRMPGIRLVQAAFNGRSMSLYTKLGFDIREPLACLQGTPPRTQLPGYPVRKMTEKDLDVCCDLCRAVHGHERRGELIAAVEQQTATVVEQFGRISGYATDIGFFAHAVAVDDLSLIALISSAERITGPGLLLPSRNGRVFRWCLENGFRFVQPMSLMSRGLYNEPKGAFLPSILF